MKKTYTHQPVLLEEVLDSLKNLSIPLHFFIDGTFGRGGHSLAIYKEFGPKKIFGIDQDHEAIQFAEENFKDLISEHKLEPIRGNFFNIEDIARDLLDKNLIPGFDGALLDLGVSSPQLDDPERGFSFYHQGPLDMRMDHRQELTAADIVNTWSEEDLISLFQNWGEIRSPFKVVTEILNHRNDKSFRQTTDLSTLIERVVGWRKKGFHPATQFFMALRLEVNQELKHLEKALIQFIQCLRPGGRLLVISFHSLEDRIIKQTFKAQQDLGRAVNKKVIQAQWPEKKKNPRARSAKLRVFEKNSM